MDGNRIHQRWREAVVGLNAKLPEAIAHRAHQLRVRTRLNDGGYERRKFRRRPARLRGELRVHKIQTEKRVFGVFNPSIEMDAAGLAGMALYRCRRIND